MIRVPRAQQSRGGPFCSGLRRHSGAMNMSVPTARLKRNIVNKAIGFECTVKHTSSLHGSSSSSLPFSPNPCTNNLITSLSSCSLVVRSTWSFPLLASLANPKSASLTIGGSCSVNRMFCGVPRWLTGQLGQLWGNNTNLRFEVAVV